MKIHGYRINRPSAEVNENLMNDLKTGWPILSDMNRDEAIQNLFISKVDIVIGQDNIWSLLLEGLIKNPLEAFESLNLKLGWTVGGRVSTTSSIS